MTPYYSTDHSLSGVWGYEERRRVHDTGIGILVDNHTALRFADSVVPDFHVHIGYTVYHENNKDFAYHGTQRML
ncbi:MAG: hypothetical protein GX338_06585 [Firmicutes bacterium]|nr:hypothetical protein [Bacillota bacterium]